MNKKLIKVDRNGTKYYEVETKCDRCGGLGGSDAWAYTGWTCYKCGGTGEGGWKIVKEYTPEYEAKLEEQRRKRAEKKEQAQRAKLPELKAEWLERNGFNADGKTYLFLGNTYDIKEEIKSLGGKFDGWLGWHIAEPVDGYQFLEIAVDEIADEDMWYGYDLSGEKCSTLRERKQVEYNRLNSDSTANEFVGAVGDKINMELRFVKFTGWEGFYGVTYLYIFKDEDGHTFVWKTSNWLNIEEGTDITVKGTIKEHNEYNGTKQTVLTRCKVEEVK